MDTFPRRLPTLTNKTSPVYTESLDVDSTSGNTALHIATLSTNYVAVRWLLLSYDEGAVDTSIRNECGLTALDIATLAYADIDEPFERYELTHHEKKEVEDARLRGAAIKKLLQQFTPGGVTIDMIERFQSAGNDGSNM